MNTLPMKELLWWFTDNGSFRDYTSGPFAQGRYVYATDSHNLIRIPKPENSKYEERDYPPVEKIVPDIDPTMTVTQQSIRDALDTYSILPDELMKACPECKNGQVEWEYTDKSHDTHTLWHDCPICNGQEVIQNGTYDYVTLGSKVFSCRSLILLLQAMRSVGANVAAISTPIHGGYRFDLNKDTMVLIMPAPVPNKSYYPTLKVEKL